MNKTALNIFNKSSFQPCLQELVVTITPSVISLCLELSPAPAKTLPAVDLEHLGHSQGFFLFFIGMSGICIGLQWLVYFWCGEDNCCICFSSPFSFFFFKFVWLSLSFWWELSSAMCWSCCQIPFSQNIKVGNVCLWQRTPRGDFSTPLECRSRLSFHENLGEIPGQAGDGAFQVGWSSSTFGSLEFSG